MELLLQMEVPRKPPSQKRATVKPIKPEAVIVISPDTKEEVKEKNSLRRKAAAEDSSRKTYTATLTARSKAACGLNIKLPKEKIEDIDAGDVYNELAVVESLADMLKFLSSIFQDPAEADKPFKIQRELDETINILAGQEFAEDMAITQHSRNRRIKGGTLIVCPMALLGQWKDELEAHSKPDSISVFVHYGGTRCGLDNLYGLLSAAYKADGGSSIFHKVDWHRIVLDEAHTIKSWRTVSARAAFTLSVHCRWCLTGTPLQLIQRPYENGDKRELKLIKAILRPLMLRRTKETKDKEERCMKSMYFGMISYDSWKANIYIFNAIEYKVHSYNRNGLCVLGFMDDHYPVRSAFSLLNQDPAEADKLLKIQRELDGTKIFLVRKALYETYEGSPISKGTLQPDMWGVTPSNQWDWVALRAMIEKNEIIYEVGSVQKIPEIPDELKLIYKTVWEIKQRTLVDMAADRGCYIDQSQSLNIHMDQPNFGKLTSMHFYAWSEFISLHISDLICLGVLIDYLTYTDTQGLKTGMYYLDHVQRLMDLFEIPAPAWMNVSLRMKHVPENDNNLINKKALALQVELCYEKNGGVATFLFFSLTMFLKVWYD
nr:putative SWI/SNF-related matrix-associated actin-dependent regulator of chromatin subfamily A member 3-like 3 [Ipomoea trifida]